MEWAWESDDSSFISLESIQWKEHPREQRARMILFRGFHCVEQRFKSSLYSILPVISTYPTRTRHGHVIENVSAWETASGKRGFLGGPFLFQGGGCGVLAFHPAFEPRMHGVGQGRVTRKEPVGDLPGLPEQPGVPDDVGKHEVGDP